MGGQLLPKKRILMASSMSSGSSAGVMYLVRYRIMVWFLDSAARRLGGIRENSYEVNWEYVSIETQADIFISSEALDSHGGDVSRDSVFH